MYTKASQKKIIDKTTSEFQKLLSDEGYGEIQTLIKSLDEFYDAEEYHQDYIQKNPNGYCPDHSTGVAFNKAEVPNLDHSLLLSGTYVLVIDSQDSCPYCEKFKHDVATYYP